MNITEIKKELYKQKPKANLVVIKQHSVLYHCVLNDMELYFDVPLSDIGDASFYSAMPSQQLIRWFTISNYVATTNKVVNEG